MNRNEPPKLGAYPLLMLVLAILAATGLWVLWETLG